MKTPSYVRNAQNRYNAKFDIIKVKLDKGTKERIKSVTQESYNEYVKNLIMNDLEQRETEGEILPVGIFCGCYKMSSFKNTEDAKKEIDNIRHDILSGKYDDFLEITEEQRERKAQSIEILSVCER